MIESPFAPPVQQDGAPDDRPRPLLRVLVVMGTVLVLLVLAGGGYAVTHLSSVTVPSSGMSPTIQKGDRLVLVRAPDEIRRGDVVVFDGVEAGWVASAAEGSARLWVRRVVGIPGDRVACCTRGHLTVQPAGVAKPVEIFEDYTDDPDPIPFCGGGGPIGRCPPGSAAVVVPAGRLFLLADNRLKAADSRAFLDNAFAGTVPLTAVKGRAVLSGRPGRVHRLSPPAALSDLG